MVIKKFVLNKNGYATVEHFDDIDGVEENVNLIKNRVWDKMACFFG